MADETPQPDEITDETINTMVAFVETAEQLAVAMNMLPVSRAYRFMLETSRAMSRLAAQRHPNFPPLPTKAH